MGRRMSGKRGKKKSEKCKEIVRDAEFLPLSKKDEVFLIYAFVVFRTQRAH